MRIMVMKARNRAKIREIEAARMLGLKTARSYARFLRYPRDWTLEQARTITTQIGLNEDETRLMLHEDLPDIALPYASSGTPAHKEPSHRNRPLSKKEKWEKDVKEILTMARTRKGMKLKVIAQEMGYGTEQGLCTSLKNPSRWNLDKLRAIRKTFGLTDEEYEMIVKQY